MGVSRRAGHGYDFAAAAGGARFELDCGGQIELKTSLRWYGHLRSEPARLPWGIGLGIELSGVETAAGMMPITGGLRMGFTPKEGAEPLWASAS